MSIYIAASTAGTRNPDHPIFTAKGLVGLTPCAPSRVPIQAVSLTSPPAYTIYAANISHFVSATSNKDCMPLTTFCSPLSLHRPVIPLQLPKLAYVPNFKHTVEDVDDFLHSFSEFQPQKHKVGKGWKIVFNKPSAELHAMIQDSCADQVSCDSDELHPAAFREFLFLLHIISEFISTHTYADVSDPDAMDVEGKSILRDVRMELGAKMDMSGYSLPSYAVDLRDLFESCGAVIGEPNNETLWNEFEVAYAEKIKVIDPTCHYTSSIQTNDFCVKAKPSPLPYTVNVGTGNEIPAIPGFLFPYFPGMLSVDTEFLPSIISLLFLKLFGPTTAEMADRFSAASRAYVNIARTPEGETLKHIFFGVRLALDGHARLFLIIERGEYLGFSLHGENVVIRNGRKILSALPTVELHKLKKDLRSSAAAIDRIAELLDDMKPVSGNDDDDYEVAPTSITSPLALARELRHRKMPSETSDEYQDLLTSFSQLNFETRPLSMNHGGILEFLNILARKRDVLDGEDDGYIFLSHQLERYRDPLYSALCLFGPEAPSPINTQGSEIRTPSYHTIGSGDQAKYELDAAPPAKAVIFARKKVHIAYNDWKSFFKSGMVIMKMEERGKMSRCIVLADNAASSIWVGLTRAFEAQKTIKRKVRTDEEVEGEEPSKKRAKGPLSMKELLERRKQGASSSK